MKVTVLYFSGTGNTWYVAKELTKVLQKSCEVRCHSIEETFIDESVEEIISNTDHIIIGYPIYGSMAPKPMVEFIDRLPNCHGKKVSVFTTVALASGDGPIVYRELLVSKGYQFVNGMQFIANNNFNVPGFPDVLRVGSDEKVEKRYEKIRYKVSIMAENIIKGTSKVRGDNVLGRLLGNTQRKHVEELIVKINSNMYVGNNRCINCMKCVKACPVSNIKDVNGMITINKKCIGCMRCYHICPTAAINITEKSMDVEKWPRFKMKKEFEKSVLNDSKEMF